MQELFLFFSFFFLKNRRCVPLVCRMLLAPLLGRHHRNEFCKYIDRLNFMKENFDDIFEEIFTTANFVRLINEQQLQ